MKSEHRHQLETNVLATRLDTTLERLRPYASTIAGIVVAVVVVMFLWSYWAGSSSARQSEAWDMYNLAVGETIPNVDELRQSAQEHPGTKMQQMADVTWADSQVWVAARDYVYNHATANEALTKAMSAYQSVIQSSPDERLLNRARLGMARAQEIQGKLDEARATYLTVKGAFEDYAKRQAERLAEPNAKETYAWLANARPQLPRAPLGPGTPGEKPEFSEGDIGLPGGTGTTAPTAPGATPTQEQSIDDLLKGLELDYGQATGTDKYAPGSEMPATPGTDGAAPAPGQPNETGTGSTPPATGNTANPPPAAPADQSTKPADSTATPPAAEKPAQ